MTAALKRPDIGDATTVALSRHRLGITAWPALVLLAASATTGCQSSPVPDRPAARATASAAPAGKGTDCPATQASGRKTGLATAPEGVSWQRFRTVAVPASPALGPKKTSGDIARCYAHNPAGALLAACQIGTRLPLSPQWMTVAEEQTYGDGRDGYLGARARREAAPGPPSSPAPGEMLQLAGFRFGSYSDQRAVISLAYRRPGGALIQAGTATVRWEGGASGDWRYEIPGAPGPYQKLGSLKGYILWGAPE